MSKEQLQTRVSTSIKDAEKDKVTSNKQLLEEIEGWNFKLS